MPEAADRLDRLEAFFTTLCESYDIVRYRKILTIAYNKTEQLQHKTLMKLPAVVLILHCGGIIKKTNLHEAL